MVVVFDDVGMNFAVLVAADRVDVFAEGVEGGDLLVERSENVETSLPQDFTVGVRVCTSSKMLLLTLIDDWNTVVEDDEGVDVFCS